MKNLFVIKDKSLRMLHDRKASAKEDKIQSHDWIE